MIIQALGFEPEDVPKLWGVDGLEVARWGTIKIDFQSKQTSLPGVFAAGDIVRGASLVVWAIKDGRDAADAIVRYIESTASLAAE
jgi:glutamate synthase (NADPH/NADH) small chain